MSVQYIALENVKTTVQTIACLKTLDDPRPFTRWGLPAAMSTDDPKRRIMSHWKNKACRQVEALMMTDRAAALAQLQAILDQDQD